jgi:hypothetical protein
VPPGLVWSLDALANYFFLELRIHKDTERGDNDTVKVAGKTVKIDGRKCSDR